MKELKKQKLNKIFCEFKENDMSSYDTLYKEYYSIVYGIVFSILKNKESTEDVVQEIFLKIYNMDKERLPEKGELSWIYTVSKNEALNYLRKKKQEVNIEEIYEALEEPNEIEEFIDIYTYNKIISGLNEQEKQIVSLKILSNFTFKKIGQMLSMPTPTVQWKYYKAVDSLKISLGNFAGFIFMFFLLLIRKEKVKNDDGEYLEKSEEMMEDTTFNKDSQSSTSTSGTDNIKEDSNVNKSNSINKINEGTDVQIQNTISSFQESTLQDTSKSQEKIDIVEPILMSFCGIFLTISIIFAILFKNHQQKRSKKASK